MLLCNVKDHCNRAKRKNKEKSLQEEIAEAMNLVHGKEREKEIDESEEELEREIILCESEGKNKARCDVMDERRVV